LRGKGCPKCFGNLKYTTETFKGKVFEMYKDEYDVLGQYVNSQTKIKMRHNCCDYIYSVKPNNFINGRQCPNCKNERLSEINRKSQEQFEREVKELTFGEYVVIGEYKGKKKKVKLLHDVCGEYYSAIPENFFRGSRCPVCNISKGERKIKDFLQKHDIPFEVEYSFDDLRHFGLLRFDFAIFNNKEKENVSCLIEYDGEFHFDPIIDEQHLENQQHRDKLKDQYCSGKGINLIRIAYWNYDVIDEILTNELLKGLRNEEEFKIWLQ
jgi:hypothetical protein